MVLQEETLDLGAEKQVEKTLFHSLHEAFVGRRKESPRTPPKSTPKPSPEALGSTPRRPWKPVTQKSHFCRQHLIRGSAVCLPWARETTKPSFIVPVPYYFDMYVESVTLEYAAVHRGVFTVGHLASSPQSATCR